LIKENPRSYGNANEILKDAAGFFRQRPETVKSRGGCMKYITLRRESGSAFHTMWPVVKVSESGYYRSLQSAWAAKNRGSCFWSKYREVYKENRT